MTGRDHHALSVLLGRLGEQAARYFRRRSLTRQTVWVISRLPIASEDLEQARRMARLRSCDCLQDWNEHPHKNCHRRPHTFDLSAEVWGHDGPAAERIERIRLHLYALCRSCGKAHAQKGDRYRIADLRTRPVGDGTDEILTEQVHPLLVTLDRVCAAAIECSPDRSLPGLAKWVIAYLQEAADDPHLPDQAIRDLADIMST